MSVTAVVGSQWGDEAKGKIVDLLSREARIVARYNGGDNAGHTVVNEYGTFKLRLTPNGFSHPHSACVIGPGVVINLSTLSEEIAYIQKQGIDLSDRLWISPRCHVVMPYHPLLEAIYENAKGASRTGTTRRGMGPVYADKVSYNGIRLYDLEDPDVFAAKLRVQLAVKNRIFEAFEMDKLDFDQVFQEKLEQYRAICPHVREPFGLLQQTLESGELILLEGAQGTLLDTDWGTYPFSTASTTITGGSAAGLGIAPRWISRVIGVAKAYTTRVGAGPMPTELHDQAGQTLREQGKEFGTVTGRPRRCGWFDAALVGFSARLSGFSEIALTKLDVLDSLPKIKLCSGYRQPGQGNGDAPLLAYWQGDARWLETCQPVYIEMEGWMQPTTAVRKYSDLPANAQAYIRKIEELVGVPVSIVSVGPGRDETVYKD
ncbi:MAG: adenylosuccinate synthase [Anaerolineales bacterium]